MHKLEKIIRQANKEGRCAIIPFITANYPDKRKFFEILDQLDKDADIIEIGVPFSDPVADGPVVERASRKVLAAGFDLGGLLRELAQNKGQYRAGLVLMGYLNPFLQYGLEDLARDAATAGINGLIIPDVPFEESAGIRAALEAHGLALIPLVGPNTPKERMEMYALDAKGYVYVVSVMGVTGERKSLADNVGEALALAKEVFGVPVALGFGLRHPSQLAGLPEAARPDAAIFGSALLSHIEAGGKVHDFLAPWGEC